MATFHFELVSPEKMLFSGDVDQVVVPGAEGEFTVLAGHAPFMSSLKAGVVFFDEGAGHGRRIVVLGGFADVGAKGLTILAERASPIEELSVEQMNQEIIHAQTLREALDTNEARDAADIKIAQLQELRDVLVK
jgi:F-type H+-transporting ATPase subunit epsilon